jgi:exopolyphosphatase/guanosine-5'-triphosphate,3'-diphosphate pyrophosphatase
MDGEPRIQPQSDATAQAPAATPVAALDLGASHIRLVVAEIAAGRPIRILEEASRGALLGKDTFTHGRLGAATIEATLKALEGFRRIMDGYGVLRYRAVATSAVREAANADSFIDRVRLRTGLVIETIDGSEENRLSYMAVRAALSGHEAFAAGDALVVEVGGGSADISLLRKGEPLLSGTYALGSIRMRQSLASWHGTHERRMRLLRRHIQNVVGDIRGEMRLKEARQFIALGNDVRFAATRILGEAAPEERVRVLSREAFISFCDQMVAEEPDLIAERHRLTIAESETLIPALLAYRELLSETPAERITIPEASLRFGLLLDMAGPETAQSLEDLRRQVLSSAAALGEKYRYDAVHGQNVAALAARLFDELKADHGLSDRHRLLLEVAALLHDVGAFVSLRGHHKHSQYVLSVSEIFGLSRDDMAIVSNVARYHRRALPQKSHLPFMALDREHRVEVNKMAAILRIANALDADHLQKIRDLRVVKEADALVLEVDGAGDLTMERLAAMARSDLFVETFGQKVLFRETGGQA